MPVPEHIDNVREWARLTLAGKPWTRGERGRRRLTEGTDVLFSYGSHFPLVRLIRDRHGRPSHWLVNGDTWSGGWSMTSAHQQAVRQMVSESAYPSVIVPQSVLDAAGVVTSSVQIVDVMDEWYEDREDVHTELPSRVSWRSRQVPLPGTGVWIHNETGREVEGLYGGMHSGPNPDDPDLTNFFLVDGKYDWDAYHRAQRKAEAAWTWVPMVHKENGQLFLYDANQSWRTPNDSQWSYEDRDGQLVYVKRWRRHWLGESLIKAKVPYQGWSRCKTCHATGEVEPYVIKIGGGHGPATSIEGYRYDYDRDLEWMGSGSTEVRLARGVYERHVFGTKVETVCPDCRGARRHRRTRYRWHYFISGFDHNEPQPSYFFSQMADGHRPTTLAEAYEMLKPPTVKLAEEMGRTVLRQGDRFFIEMPGLTTRDLTKMGAVRHRRGGPGREKQQAEPLNSWWTPRFQRHINMDCWLGGTTHEATEVARVGDVEYARGRVIHVPDGRAPDHVPLKLGDGKSWWLCVGNTTPS